MKHSCLFALLLPFVIFTGCIKENPVQDQDTGYLHGAFVTNEGAFGNSNGSISHLDLDSLKITNHLFESINGRPLGDVVHSFTAAGKKGFIVVNNSQKVEVVDLETFASIGSIEGLEYPRYLVPLDSLKGYLGDGNYDGRVYVIDFTTLKITDTLACGHGPENMLIYDNLLLVCNSGGFGLDSTITVIDTRTDKVSDTWQTGYNPSDLVLDRENRLWVLCKGRVEWNPDWTIGLETPSEIRILNPSDGAEITSFPIGKAGDFFWPSRLGRNQEGDHIYFLESEGLFLSGISDPGFSLELLVPGYFYGFGVEPGNGMVYMLESPSFSSSGQIKRYTPGGLFVDSFAAGIGPNQIVFN